MRQRLQLLPLERAAQLALATTVVLFVLGSTSVASLVAPGHKLRWVGLIALCAVAVAWAAARERADVPWIPFAAIGAFAGLVLLSAAWSVDPRVSVERGASLAILLVTACALAYAVAGRPDAVRRLLDAILAAASLVAVGGIVLWLAAPHTAVAPADGGNPSRFRGLGENPNTVPMLFAVALPVATLVALEGATRRRRLAGVASLALLQGSIVASGSRGALVSGLGAALFVALVVVGSWRRRAVAVAALAAIFVVSVAIMQIPKPLPPPSAAAAQPTAAAAPAKKRSPYYDAQLLLRLEDDIGHPAYGKTEVTQPRHFLGTSGRLQAWRGAVLQALHRPVAGYGFGTESRVFVDRYLTFEGGVPEDTYIGLLLQLGFVGLVAFACVVLAVAASAWRRRAALVPATVRVTAAAGGMLVAGLLLGIAQSYIYSVGNIATVSVWIGMLLVVAASAPQETA